MFETLPVLTQCPCTGNPGTFCVTSIQVSEHMTHTSQVLDCETCERKIVVTFSRSSAAEIQQSKSQSRELYRLSYKVLDG